MNNTIGKPNLEIFADTLLNEAKKNKNIIVVTSDSRGSGKLVNFGKELPSQLIEVGIAEQNLVAVCAGLSAGGKKVFGVSPASFLTARSLEQIKNDIAYSNRPAVMVGISAGISYGQLGATHHSIHDYATLRTINNMTIVSPADNFEASEVIKQSINYEKPLYIRYGKQPLLNLSSKEQNFKIGKANILKKGSDLVFIATGETVQRAYLSSQLLEKEGIQSTVVSMHTLKPFDKETFLEAILNQKVLISLEEHSVYGGLGEMCASVITQEKININYKILGIPDEYMVNGSQSDVLDHYGMSPEKLTNLAKSMIE